MEGDLDASPAAKLELLLNLRALGEPAQVRDLVERELHNLDSGLARCAMDCFSPAAPVPQRRILKAVWKPRDNRVPDLSTTAPLETTIHL